MSRARFSSIPIFAVFFFESAVLGQWIPRIPDVKAALGLDDASLGLALLCLPLGTLVGLSIAGRIIESLGLRDACRWSLPAWALLFMLPAFARGLPTLGLALALVGVAVGVIETAMNTEAARQETVLGRRVMSRCHGFWSLGSTAGALGGGAIAHAGASLVTHFLIAMPILAALGWIAATALPEADGPGGATLPEVDIHPGTAAGDSVAVDVGDSRVPRLPSRALLPLCVLPLGLMMIEGAFIDWSAVFEREVLEASPLAIGVIYAAFASIMAITRLWGDRIADRFGDVAVVRVSALAGTCGIGLFALAPNVEVAFVAAAIAGAGVAIVFPLAVSAVARRPGRSPADNVAALNMISFSAFLFAPPLIGFLSEATSLRIALLALVPGALATLLLSRELAVVPAQASASVDPPRPF